MESESPQIATLPMRPPRRTPSHFCEQLHFVLRFAWHHCEA
jgi:hypothetical protein